MKGWLSKIIRIGIFGENLMADKSFAMCHIDIRHRHSILLKRVMEGLLGASPFSAPHGVVAPKLQFHIIQMIYDVSHNVAKMEEHLVDGRPTQLCVHRKGATRAFPPHHPLIPIDYQLTGRSIL